jgi:2-isopropylmalate synthase
MNNDWQKYRPYVTVDLPDREWPGKKITQAPIWCSVDLRDGNQALVEPMGVEEKLLMFGELVRLGFKEIEVAFPSASITEFEFVRRLIEENLIPEDVTIQVLTQAREHLIRRTFASLEGAHRAIVHLYNSTSTLQREVVFGMEQDAILDLAVRGTHLVKNLAAKAHGADIRYEYSPESFTGTEMDFALRICEAVTDTWNPSKDRPIIINLPATVEMSTPNVYADQIEWVCRHLSRRDETIMSVHTHNDRGCAVAAAELSQMAGAQRVEGTLFGYGERTGNVDLVTLALNLHMHGIDCNLDLHDLPSVVRVVQECTDNPIHPRHPYAGELVFTAFSGSHQDAISKGMRALGERKDGRFEVPYLTLDPKDLGRSYEAIIRVNSQSGKGGVSYVLRSEYGLDIPKAMQPEFSDVIQKMAEASGKEVKPENIWKAFQTTYLEAEGKPFELVSFTISTPQDRPEELQCEAVVKIGGEPTTVLGIGHGPMEGFCRALIDGGAPTFEVLDYHEHSVGTGAGARAAAYVNVCLNGQTRFGAGVDDNLTRASLLAIVSALNLLAMP